MNLNLIISLFIILSLLTVCNLSAQQKVYTIVNDSIELPVVALDEVTIQARSVIEKTDRKIILPTQQQLKTSSGGVDLLSKLQLPRIMVNIMSGEITTSGGSEVQLRINGVEATYTDLAALNPEDVLRIEYHDTPGARYGAAAAVIDYITRTRKSGGNLRGDAFHAIAGDRTSIDDMLSGRYTSGKSEWAANVRYLQRKADWTREYDEWFVFPDKTVHRLEVGEPTLFNKKLLTSNLSYSLRKDNVYFLNAQLRYTLQDNPAGYDNRQSKLYSSDSDVPLSICDFTKERVHLPALDLYYQQHLNNSQLLIFNVVGTYIGSSNTRLYRESEDRIPVTDIYSDITGKKYSLIAEGVYEKSFHTGKFTGGLRHIQAYTDNQYKGDVSAEVTMQQAESYAYAEYQGQTQHWGYMANLTFSRFYYSQQSNRNEKYAFQPALQVTYTPLDALHFRYHAAFKNNTPSISSLNDVEQVIDRMQVRRGNPALKPFRSIIQDFNVVYSGKIWSIDALVNYRHEIHPIMESILYEEGTLIRTYENQKSFQQLSAEVTFKIKPYRDYITLSITPAVNRYISTGNHYRHTYTMPEVRFNLDANYKNWLLNLATIAPPNRSVYGEQLMKGDMMHMLMVGYKRHAWAIMAGVYNPFVKTYRSENVNWSVLNPVRSDIHSNNLSNTFMIKVSLNLDFGKQSRSIGKAVQNIDTDSGIMRGAKE